MALELWETLKESTVVYDAGLSPEIFVALVVLGLALFYIVSVMFRSSSQPKHGKSSDYKYEVVKDMNEVPMDTTSGQLSGPSSHLWDVFLSFYGKDTRRNFISNLYYALDQAGIVTFRDEPALEKGEEISSGLCHAIRNSKMFVVVISNNYASSSWCLDELVEILSCKRTKNQVLPVFYYVDPSDLRHQKGCFGVALKTHKKRYSAKRIEKWKSALAEIADLSGYHLKKDAKESEADTILNIVEDVMPQASSKALHLERCLFGIDQAVEDIYQQLSVESNDVRALGICGMGGIGKTTTAKAFFNKYSHKFDISCFMENVKQNSQGHNPLLPFLQKLLIELLRVKDYKARNVESALRKLKEILSSKKALIVLDDLDQSSYSELLVRICNLFSHGSRVIITARDTNLLNQLKVEMSKVETFLVKHLNQTDSLELFSYHAFKKPKPVRNYLALSESFVIYARGLPLALKVLGSSLCGRTDVSFWEAKLKKIQNIPVEDIHKILKLSYDELDDETQKAIFLDIVFFFVGKNKDEAVDVFKSCDFFPEEGIPILVERCLLIIDTDNRFEMHNLIQDMGRKIIREESKQGKCQRLYLDQEAWQALQNLEGINKIEGLILDFTMSTNKYCNAEIFEKLPNLRLLKLIDVHDIRGNPKISFHELRCISWHGCPWTHLPSAIHLQKLVYLDMAFSRFKTPWKNVKLPSLRHLNLDGCIYLKELPESIGQLTKLNYFNASNCVNLKRLPEPIIQLTTLGHLDMSNCSNLKLLPEQLGNMKGLQMLDVSGTAIEQLPDSIAHLKFIKFLGLVRCKKLRKLPEEFGSMEGLEVFNATMSAIEQLPDSFSNLSNLINLHLYSCTNLTSLPNSIWKLKSLQTLNLSRCSQLKRLPAQFGKMQCLELLEASEAAIEELPDSIGQLARLQFLNFNSCKKLTYVPDSIRNLTSLITLSLEHKDIRRLELPDAVNNMELKYLTLRCNVRVWLPMILSLSSVKVLRLYDDHGSLYPTKPFSFVKLFNLKHLMLTNCASHGSSFPELPLNLELLELDNHTSLEQVPDLSNLKHMKRLGIQKCSSLRSLQKLPPHLLTLDICDCESLQDLPDVSLLRCLVGLVVTGNGGALKVSLKESQLKVSQNEMFRFRATLQNGEIPEWFDYKNSGCTVSFDVPSNLGDNFIGVSFWIVCKYLNISSVVRQKIEAVIANKTEGMTEIYTFLGEPASFIGVADIVGCIRGDDISVKSGDRIEISFRLGETIDDSEVQVKWEVKMCGAHLILKPRYTCIQCSQYRLPPVFWKP